MLFFDKTAMSKGKPKQRKLLFSVCSISSITVIYTAR